MKKLLSILLSFALVFSFATTTAFADEPTGSIVVNNYREDVEIKI